MGLTNMETFQKCFSIDFDNLVTKANNGIGMKFMQERR